MSKFEVLADSLTIPGEKGKQAEYRKGDKVEIENPETFGPLVSQGAIGAIGASKPAPTEEPEKKKSGGDK